MEMELSYQECSFCKMKFSGVNQEKLHYFQHLDNIEERMYHFVFARKGKMLRLRHISKCHN